MVKLTFTLNEKWTKPIMCFIHSEDSTKALGILPPQFGCARHQCVNTQFENVDGANLFGQTHTQVGIFFLDVQSP
jgi:hypothetical protein